MKKYLMTGVAALAFAATFTSCSKSGDLYDESKVEEQKIASVTEKYDEAFIKAFGQPASNQDWGFASRKLPASFGAGTRGAQTNSNQWGTHDDNDKYLNYPKPADITPEERAAVLAVFNQKGKESYEDILNLKNFFVQQVYCGPNGTKMNQLACVTNWVKTKDWPETWEQRSTYTDDELNNFNGGKYSGNAEQGCMLAWYSSTSDWSFKTSQSGGQRIYGHWRMEKINGNYYVGLDHEAWRQAPANANEEDKRDYIYNDWIVKIVPGIGDIPEPNRYTVRIICEDLMANASSDFDFNDVVFDASYAEGSTTTFITIKAAGGTIPLYIEGNEVHKLFQEQYPDAGIILPADGVKGTMINTRATGGVEVGDATLTINRIIAPWDIAITINNGGTTIPLKAEVGSPAAKIAVNPSFDWLDERADITKVCPNFSSYVQDTTVNWY